MRWMTASTTCRGGGADPQLVAAGGGPPDAQRVFRRPGLLNQPATTRQHGQQIGEPPERLWSLPRFSM